MRDDILGRWPDASRLLDELIDLDEETRARRVAEIGARDPALVPLLSALATDTSALEARFRPVATSLSADSVGRGPGSRSGGALSHPG